MAKPGFVRDGLFSRLRVVVAGEEVGHALHGAEDVLGRVGVGDADIALAEDAEIRAADDRDTLVVGRITITV